MDLMVITASVLSGGAAIWLWRLSKAKVIDLAVETQITPWPSVKTSYKLSTTAVWYKIIFDRISFIFESIVNLLSRIFKRKRVREKAGKCETILKEEERLRKEREEQKKLFSIEDIEQKKEQERLCKEEKEKYRIEIETRQPEKIKVGSKEIGKLPQLYEIKEKPGQLSRDDVLASFGFYKKEEKLEPIKDHWCVYIASHNLQSYGIVINKPVAEKVKPIKPFEEAPKTKYIEYSGKAVIPEKVYVGDSHNISITLEPTFGVLSTGDKTLKINDIANGKSIFVKVVRDSSLEQFLEIELLAAGLKVDGEKKQRQNVASKTLYYCWNCYFPNSGDHKISLILRLATPSGTIKLGDFQHSIKVAKLDHLTKRQVWLLASLAAIISGSFTIVEVMNQIGVW